MIFIAVVISEYLLDARHCAESLCLPHLIESPQLRNEVAPVIALFTDGKTETSRGQVT